MWICDIHSLWYYYFSWYFSFPFYYVKNFLIFYIIYAYLYLEEVFPQLNPPSTCSPNLIFYVFITANIPQSTLTCITYLNFFCYFKKYASTIFLSRVSLILIFLSILIAPEISYKYVSISHPYNFQSPGPYFYLFLAINFLHLIYCQSFLLNAYLFHSRWHSWAPLILFFLMIANEV